MQRRALWLVFAIASVLPRTSAAQNCAPSVAGGVVVTEGRGGMGARLAASAQGIVVSWVEQRAFASADFRGAGGSASHFYARVVDRTSVTPRGAAQSLFDQSAPYELGMGRAVAQTSDGRSAGVLCTCVGGSANTLCTSTTLVRTPAFGELRPRMRQSSVCPQGALDTTTAAQLSQAGVEAGDSEVVTDETNVFAVWQEIPSARGARAELRVARLGCR